MVWSLAEKFGWSLEYIRGLSMQDIHDYQQILDAREKAKEKPTNKI